MIERGGGSEKANHTLRRYQALGMFQPNQIESLKHPETDYLPYLINHRLGQLVLQVTQQCNLRCEYCIYSGIYNDHRQHQSSFMTYDIAKRAIDFICGELMMLLTCAWDFMVGNRFCK